MRSAFIVNATLARCGWMVGSCWAFAAFWQLIFLPDTNGTQIFVAICEFGLAATSYWFAWRHTRRATEIANMR